MSDPHRTRQLAETDRLRITAPWAEFRDIYLSQHQRTNSQESIRLYHFFDL